MNQLISNVLMQPKLDAVERPMTLIEKLKHEYDDRELTCQDLFEDGHFDDKKTELLIQQTGVMAGLQIAIDIVKQHQAESGWISADERLPPDNMMVLAYCNIRKTTGYAFVSQQQAWSFYHFTKNSENQALAMANDISKWMPIPQPPSEVQDAT